MRHKLITVSIDLMTYTKLDAGITDSTIWQAPDATRLVWITMLAMADQHGYVGASMPGLAGRARVALDACVEAIKTLESPDEWSRTKEHEGRRIVRAEGGWVLLNHAKYRAKQSADDRRERSRLAMAELRTKRKLSLTHANGDPALTKLPVHAPKLTQAEAEYSAAPLYCADAEENASSLASLPAAGEVSPDPSQPPSTVSASSKPPRKRASKPAGKSKSAETWARYAEAYAARYGAQPVRNARVNGQLAQLVGRLGADEAPAVAAFYVQTRTSLYVAAKHCTDLLLRDAEKLRTEWATGNVTYQRDAREADRLGSTGAMWEKIGQKLKAEGIE